MLYSFVPLDPYKCQPIRPREPDPTILRRHSSKGNLKMDHDHYSTAANLVARTILRKYPTVRPVLHRFATTVAASGITRDVVDDSDTGLETHAPRSGAGAAPPLDRSSTPSIPSAGSG